MDTIRLDPSPMELYFQSAINILKRQPPHQVEQSLPIREFENKVFNKGLKKMFRDGSKIIQKEVKALTPKGESGFLRQAIKVRAAKRQKHRIGVDVQIGRGLFVREPFYRGIH